MKATPDSAEELIAELERDYPPRCKDPQESLEDHSRYAGQVELIQNLRRRFEWTQQHNTAENLLNKI